MDVFRDPFNRRVMGLALGTFTYALMVLRAVRSPLDEVAQQGRRTLEVGPVRTMQEDPSHGIRQLADVALIALSPASPP